MRHFIDISILTCTSLAITAVFSSPNSIPTYAPIPPTGFGPPVSNFTGVRVQAFGGGAYLLTDGLYQSLFLVAGESVIVVDAPPTLGHNMLKGIRAVTDLPVSHVIYSHSHADHIGAAYLLGNANVTFIAHEKTAEELSEVKDTTRPAPSITFSNDLDINVGNQSLKLSYNGPNHEPGNIFVYAPSQKVLMVVDIVFPGWVPYHNLGESQNIPGYVKAHDQMLEYDFDHFLGGHLDRSGTRDDVLTAREYITDLYNNAVEAILMSAQPPSGSNPLSLQTALTAVEAANPGNSWAQFDFYIDDLMADWCANKTNEKWLGRLAGADVYGQANSATMLNSVRIDWGILGPTGVT